MFDEKSYSLKMDKAIEVFSKEISSLRTGRANAAMLDIIKVCLLYTSPSPRDLSTSRMPSSA